MAPHFLASYLSASGWPARAEARRFQGAVVSSCSRRPLDAAHRDWRAHFDFRDLSSKPFVATFALWSCFLQSFFLLLLELATNKRLETTTTTEVRCNERVFLCRVHVVAVCWRKLEEEGKSERNEKRDEQKLTWLVWLSWEENKSIETKAVAHPEKVQNS